MTYEWIKVSDRLPPIGDVVPNKISHIMNASREAYDLHNPACRANAWARLKRGKWKSIWFLKLIWSDTINNVCPVTLK